LTGEARMNKVWDFVQDIDWLLVTQDALGKVAAIVIGIVLTWLVFFRHLWKFRLGDSDDILFQAHYLVPRDEKYVLVFRTVAPPTAIKKLYDNSAAQRLVRQLADDTSLDDPILKTEGHLGFEVVNDVVNYVAGFLSLASFPTEEWLLTVTCEDRKVARKKCIRVFLIRQRDLERFADWEWCRTTLLTEAPWHFFRIMALHKIAGTFAAESAPQPLVHQGSVRDQLLVEPRARHPRIRRLALSIKPEEIAVGAPSQPNWDEVTPYLRSIGMPWAR
jgi:hypothetical protein